MDTRWTIYVAILNYTYAVVSIVKPTDPCFSEELEVPEEQSKDIIIAGIIC